MPEKISVFEFNKAIIDATSDLVCAYKPNIAFFEALGEGGIEVLERTRNYVPSALPVIIDAKRSDIGNSAKAYARALFDILGFDASTVNPYLGFDSIEPFLEYQDKVILLCRTSNPVPDFQSALRDLTRLAPTYQVVASKAENGDAHGNIGLVVELLILMN
jgi:orotidine-5'-phosphate decarboxylase